MTLARGGLRWPLLGLVVLVGCSEATAPRDATTTQEATTVDPDCPRREPAAPTPEAIEKARVHYERGVRLNDACGGVSEAGMFELERSYELVPNDEILYLLARAKREQHDYAGAYRGYTRYLRDGGPRVDADRRDEISKELAVLKSRTAEIRVRVNVDGAKIVLDDIPLCRMGWEWSDMESAHSPLREPLVVNVGRHKVTAVKAGYTPATTTLGVLAAQSVEVVLSLHPASTTPRK